ncbi:MAG: hypothetical protein ACI9MR_000759 [Myxococcota bacterium]|jgi:hypothetical protein
MVTRIGVLALALLGTSLLLSTVVQAQTCPVDKRPQPSNLIARPGGGPPSAPFHRPIPTQLAPLPTQRATMGAINPNHP